MLGLATLDLWKSVAPTTPSSGRDLERHSAVMSEVSRQVYQRHPPLAQLALQQVSIAEGLAELIQHGRWT
jgi:hypothetical protein